MKEEKDIEAGNLIDLYSYPSRFQSSNLTLEFPFDRAEALPLPLGKSK